MSLFRTTVTAMKRAIRRLRRRPRVARVNHRESSTITQVFAPVNIQTDTIENDHHGSQLDQAGYDFNAYGNAVVADSFAVPITNRSEWGSGEAMRIEGEGEELMSDQTSLTIASSESSSSTSIATRQLEHAQLAYDFMAAYAIVEQRRVAIEHARRKKAQRVVHTFLSRNCTQRRREN
ncbi:uncharacterized protein LAESUDRAFT_728126 [Laetiporus sulphureus 93-53]|uniref:Uncharacterized protein n=1 Tax=Laetiporus sulphureus 93-53 TaxID=1314785 RepID=A0A165D885_9APHY|nr:uncharacterized protein LAESUDRAFT_728126 [Laetiporus sulphureus 93-53]KZT04311.1 hypothetical protein LAESUDRAFT_728126 [Laetiporus sulphureus 93-53]